MGCSAPFSSEVQAPVPRVTSLHDMENESLESSISQLVLELQRNNELMVRLIESRRNWKLLLRQGLLTGLGTVIGATVLVSALVWILQPLKKLEVLKPTLDRIAQELERRPVKQSDE